MLVFSLVYHIVIHTWNTRTKGSLESLYCQLIKTAIYKARRLCSFSVSSTPCYGIQNSDELPSGVTYMVDLINAIRLILIRNTNTYRKWNKPLFPILSRSAALHKNSQHPWLFVISLEERRAEPASICVSN